MLKFPNQICIILPQLAKNSLGYKDSGVDIDAGNKLVSIIKPLAKQTRRDGTLDSIGGFGALFELPLNKYKNPVLVSGADGVGTKLKLAIDLNRHSTIGIDLVAMCANDLIVQGAEPLFFLDYLATARLKLENATAIITGISEGCKLANIALIGGETAEMPGMYSEDDYDLAGFCVGIVDKDKIINGDKVEAGDKLIGIASSGPHSNGYSLIRKIIEVSSSNLNDKFATKTLGDILLEPTRIYVKSILELVRQFEVKSIAHITGGGLLENLPRVMPKGCQAVIDKTSWQMPEIFVWLQKNGNVEDSEMLRTFNCGVGMALVVGAQYAKAVIKTLTSLGETAWELGEIQNYTDVATAQVIIK